MTYWFNQWFNRLSGSGFLWFFMCFTGFLNNGVFIKAKSDYIRVTEFTSSTADPGRILKHWFTLYKTGGKYNSTHIFFYFLFPPFWARNLPIRTLIFPLFHLFIFSHLLHFYQSHSIFLLESMI